MPETTDRAVLVKRIETALTTGLMHPGTGNGPIPLALPMFSNSTMPGEMARHFAEDAGLPHANVARLVAEALVDEAIEGVIDILENADEHGAADTVRRVAKAAA